MNGTEFSGGYRVACGACHADIKVPFGSALEKALCKNCGGADPTWPTLLTGDGADASMGFMSPSSSPSVTRIGCYRCKAVFSVPAGGLDENICPRCAAFKELFAACKGAVYSINVILNGVRTAEKLTRSQAIYRLSVLRGILQGGRPDLEAAIAKAKEVLNAPE